MSRALHELVAERFELLRLHTLGGILERSHLLERILQLRQVLLRTFQEYLDRVLRGYYSARISVGEKLLISYLKQRGLQLSEPRNDALQTRAIRLRDARKFFAALREIPAKYSRSNNGDIIGSEGSGERQVRVHPF